MAAGSLFFFSSRRRHTRCLSDWSSDVCSSDLWLEIAAPSGTPRIRRRVAGIAKIRATTSARAPMTRPHRPVGLGISMLMVAEPGLGPALGAEAAVVAVVAVVEY